MKNKVLVLGSTGLLGAMVTDYLFSKPDIELAVSYRKKSNRFYFFNELPTYSFDASTNPEKELGEILFDFQPDYVINCIGIIKPHCKDDDPLGIERAVKINSMFPYILSEIASEINPDIKIIQIATDCVYDGVEGKYTEQSLFSPNDVYGRTKSLGEVVSQNFLNIRTSIIGPEVNNHLSLMDWFLNSPIDKILKGYRHHQWNGVTTLQFSEFCYETITKNKFDFYRAQTPVFHYVVNKDVTKYELLQVFKQVFETAHQIQEVNTPPPSIDRTLRSSFFKFEQTEMEESVRLLKRYMQISKLFADKSR